MTAAADRFTTALGTLRGADRKPATGRFEHVEAAYRVDAAQEQVRLVEECLASEARTAEAHHDGYERVANRARALLTQASATLRAAVLGGERELTLEQAEARLEEMETVARDVAGLLENAGEFKTLPAGRRRYLAEQPVRLRGLSEGDVPAAYYQLRYLGHERDVLLRDRAKTPPGA